MEILGAASVAVTNVLFILNAGDKCGLNFFYLINFPLNFTIFSNAVYWSTNLFHEGFWASFCTRWGNPLCFFYNSYSYCDVPHHLCLNSVSFLLCFHNCYSTMAQGTVYNTHLIKCHLACLIHERHLSLDHSLVFAPFLLVQDANTITCCNNGKINSQLSLCKISIKNKSFHIFRNMPLQLTNWKWQKWRNLLRE